jgi:HK97 family phage major capsid protein
MSTKVLSFQLKRLLKLATKAVNPVPVAAPEMKSAEVSVDAIKSLDTYLRHGKKGLKDAEFKALASDRDTDGGIFVHAELQNRMIEQLDDVLQLRRLATVINTSRGSVPFPTFEFTGTISNVAEGATLSEVSISNAFGKQVFTPHKKAVLFKIPEELIEDADFDILGHMVDHFVTRMAEELEDDMINGTGVEEPLGLLQANLTAVDLSSSATNITTVSVLEAPTQLKLQYRRNAAYIMSRDQLEEANKLLDTQGRPLFKTAPNLAAGQPPQLNGYPLVEVERMTAPAADGDCSFILGDMKNYWLVERKGITVRRLEERYADEGKVGIIVSMRVDGSPVVQEGFVRYNRN